MSATIATSVSAKDLKSRATRIAKAIKQLDALSYSAHASLGKREILNTSGMFYPKVLTIAQFRNLVMDMVSVDVQRDHLRRIEHKEVGYLQKLHLTHVCFTVVINPRTGKLELADGNTRVALNFLEDGTTPLPSEVMVMVYNPDNTLMYKDVYHCIDSPVNAKRTRHNITSFYKNAGLVATTLSSNLVRDANLVSAFRRVAMFKGIGSITRAQDKENLELLVHSVIDELRYLDLFGFKAKQLGSQGFYAAILIIKSKLRAGRFDELTDFINEIEMFVKGNHVKISKPIADMFIELNRLFPQGWSGETPVDVVFGTAYLTFQDYLLYRGKNASKFESAHIKLVIDALPSLPQHFSSKIEAVNLKVLKSGT